MRVLCRCATLWLCVLLLATALADETNDQPTTTTPSATETTFEEATTTTRVKPTKSLRFDLPNLEDEPARLPNVSRVLASGCKDGSIRIWNLDTGVCTQTLRANAHSDLVMCVEELSKGRLASGSADSTIKLWSLHSGVNTHTLVGHYNKVSSLKAIPGTNKLASGSWDGTLRLWNVDNGECLVTLSLHSSYVYCLEYVGANLLASGSDDGTVEVWNLQTYRVATTFMRHKDAVLCARMVCWDKLATGSKDNTIKVWNLSGPVVYTAQTLHGHTGYVTALATYSSMRGISFASASTDMTVRIWNRLKGVCTHTLVDRHHS